MKKYYCLFLSFFICGLIHAQSNISFGLKGGVSFYNLKGEDMEDFDLRAAPHGGVFAQIPVSPNFRIQPELLYSSEGAKANEDDATFSIRFNYLALPVMLQFTTTEGAYFEAGPQVGFLLSARSILKENGDTDEEDIKENVNKAAFSLGIGAGYLPKKIGFGARYNFGLSRLPKDEDDGNIKSQGFTLSFLYRF